MKDKAINGIKYWGQLFLLPIYWLSFLFPRSKNIWLFGSTFGRRFADNPRYFYLYVSQLGRDDTAVQTASSLQEPKNKKIRAIWISHDKSIVEFLISNGYEAYYYHSLKGIWYCLRGKVYIFDNYSKDISFWLSGGAKKINLWHGVGNKCINYDNKHDKVRHPKNVWEKFKYFPRRLSDEKPSHYILTTSPVMTEIFERAFQCKKGHAIEVGYPRNDVLLRDEDKLVVNNLLTDKERELLEKIYTWKIKSEDAKLRNSSKVEEIISLKDKTDSDDRKKVVAYLPTFRTSENKFSEVMDLEKFNKFLEENNLIMVCKLHPKSLVKKEFENIKYSNIYNVSSEVDVNSFLREVDILVADYSSAYSDFMLLNRPVVAFHYDYEEYAGDTRDAYFDFDEYMPEVRATNMDELMQGLTEVLEEDNCKDARADSCSKIFKYKDASACERLAESIFKLL